MIARAGTMGMAFAIGLCAAAMADDSSVGIELNKLEQTASSCRSYLVIENGTNAEFSELTLDLVVFDTDGVIAERLALGLAPLSAGKVLVKAFDLKGLTCESTGRFLLNGVIGCTASTAEGCAAPIVPSARGDLSFIG